MWRSLTDGPYIFIYIVWFINVTENGSKYDLTWFSYFTALNTPQVKYYIRYLIFYRDGSNIFQKLGSCTAYRLLYTSLHTPQIYYIVECQGSIITYKIDKTVINCFKWFSINIVNADMFQILDLDNMMVIIWIVEVTNGTRNIVPYCSVLCRNNITVKSSTIFENILHAKVWYKSSRYVFNHLNIYRIRKYMTK